MGDYSRLRYLQQQGDNVIGYGRLQGVIVRLRLVTVKLH